MPALAQTLLLLPLPLFFLFPPRAEIQGYIRCKDGRKKLWPPIPKMYVYSSLWFSELRKKVFECHSCTGFQGGRASLHYSPHGFPTFLLFLGIPFSLRFRPLGVGREKEGTVGGSVGCIQGCQVLRTRKCHRNFAQYIKKCQNGIIWHFMTFLLIKKF